MLRLYDDLKDIDNSVEMMQAAAFPKESLTGMPGKKGEHHDIGDVYLRYLRSMYDRNEELRKMMWYLSDEEDSIQRLWTCFYALPDPFYTIIKHLYVDKELYQTVEKEFEWSHRTFERYRRDAMELLIKLYHSEMSVSQLIAQSNKETVEVKKSTKNHTEEYEQICLEFLT